MDLKQIEAFRAVARHGGFSRSAGIVPRMRLETQYGATLCHMVATGLGVALVNPLVAEDHGALPIVARPFEPEVTFTSRLLWCRGEAHGRLAEAFAQVIREEAATSTRRLSGNQPSGLPQAGAPTPARG